MEGTGNVDEASAIEEEPGVKWLASASLAYLEV